MFIKTLSRKVWKNGRVLDLWSVVHLLGGASLAVTASSLGFHLITGFGMAFGLIILWEIYEVLRDIEETVPNRLLDVVVGSAGFFSFYDLTRTLEPVNTIIVSIITCSLWILLMLWGYLSYRSIHSR